MVEQEHRLYLSEFLAPNSALVKEADPFTKEVVRLLRIYFSNVVMNNRDGFNPQNNIPYDISMMEDYEHEGFTKSTLTFIIPSNVNGPLVNQFYRSYKSADEINDELNKLFIAGAIVPLGDAKYVHFAISDPRFPVQKGEEAPEGGKNIKVFVTFSVKKEDSPSLAEVVASLTKELEDTKVALGNVSSLVNGEMESKKQEQEVKDLTTSTTSTTTTSDLPASELAKEQEIKGTDENHD